MANPEHLAKLKEGVEVWNEWREPQWPATRILLELDLSGADFSGADLSKAHLAGVNLAGADLRESDLSSADLKNAKLTRSHFSGANLFGADFSGANLREANLSSTNLTGTNFTGADLTDAYLLGADLSITSYENVNLSRADLAGADLRDTILIGVKLRDAYLRDVNLSGSDLSTTDLSGANLIGNNTLSQVQINSAYGSYETRLPEGLEYPKHWPNSNDDSIEIATEVDEALPLVPDTPAQLPAPLEVQWNKDQLVATDRPIPASSASNRKGQQANFNKLREILERLEGDPRGANAAPEVGEAVAAYRDALGDRLEALHGYNIGFAGLVLADAFRAAADDLLDGYKGKVQALLTLNDHLVSQDPEWVDYVSSLRASKISLQADEEAEQSAEEVILVFEDLTEVISPGIATRLRALRRSANRVRQMDPKVLKPLWDSFENTLRALGARVVEEWAAGSETVTEAVGILQDQLGPPLAKGGRKALDLGKKVASDVGKETYKKLVQFSGAGGALYILWLAHPQLLKISQSLGFTWLEHLLNFIRTVAGG